MSMPSTANRDNLSIGNVKWCCHWGDQRSLQALINVAAYGSEKLLWVMVVGKASAG